jgi:hypothetical protein
MSADMHHDAFPSDETLAAFIDGRLDAETRQRVVDHVSSCSECTDIVIASNAFETVPNVRTFPKRTLIVAAAIAAAVVLVAVLVPLRIWLAKPAVGIATLGEASPQYRTFAGRITAFPYRPPQPVFRGAEEADGQENWAFAGVAAKAAEAAKQHPTAANLHSFGVSELVMRDAQTAVTTLEDAVRTSTGRRDIHEAVAACNDAALLSDLSAAYTANADATRTAKDRAAAVDVAQRAWALRHDSEIAWNRAIALERMSRTDAARAAWQDYLALDPHSPWSSEAAAHLRRLN